MPYYLKENTSMVIWFSIRGTVTKNCCVEGWKQCIHVLLLKDNRLVYSQL